MSLRSRLTLQTNSLYISLIYIPLLSFFKYILKEREANALYFACSFTRIFYNAVKQDKYGPNYGKLSCIDTYACLCFFPLRQINLSKGNTPAPLPQKTHPKRRRRISLRLSSEILLPGLLVKHRNTKLLVMKVSTYQYVGHTKSSLVPSFY